MATTDLFRDGQSHTWDSAVTILLSKNLRLEEVKDNWSKLTTFYWNTYILKEALTSKK